MRIQTFVLAHQEEKMLPYTMRHYTPFSEVILLEGHSTDRTVEIAESWGAKVWNYDTNDQVDDRTFLEIKNNCWKNSDADWVIICDADEFVYSKNLIGILENTEHTIFMPHLFNMFSDHFPTTEGQIYEEVQYGKEGGAKMNLFRPDQIKEINYGIGCHVAHPEGNVKLCITSEIRTFHMRHLSADYVIKRNAYLNSRRSQENKDHGLGYHLEASPAEVRTYMKNEMTAILKVI